MSDSNRPGMTRSGTSARHPLRAAEWSRGGRRFRPALLELEGRWVPGFAPPVPYTVGPAAMEAVTAYFNDDTIPDLATANANNSTVSVLLGDGNGGFGAAEHWEAPIRRVAQVVAVAVAAGNASIPLAVLLGLVSSGGG